MRNSTGNRAPRATGSLFDQKLIILELVLLPLVTAWTESVLAAGPSRGQTAAERCRRMPNPPRFGYGDIVLVKNQKRIPAATCRRVLHSPTAECRKLPDVRLLGR